MASRVSVGRHFGWHYPSLGAESSRASGNGKQTISVRRIKEALGRRHSAIRICRWKKPKPKQARPSSPARPDGTRICGDEPQEDGRECRHWKKQTFFCKTQALARLLATFCLKKPVDTCGSLTALNRASRQTKLLLHRLPCIGDGQKNLA